MSNRTNEKGFPYSNDPVKVAAIAEVIAKHLIAEVEPGRVSSLELAIEEHSEYDGLKNGEFWLAVMKASTDLHEHALQKFTHLITDKDECDD